MVALIEIGDNATRTAADVRTPATLREEVAQDPSLAGRLVGLAVRLTVRPALAVGSHLPNVPWPWGLVDFAARAVALAPGSVHATIPLPHCTARMVCAAGAQTSGVTRVVLYLHGGALVLGGANTHGRLAATLSHYADAPVLVVNYRMLPKHPVGAAIDDCYDGYRWLRDQGYEPDEIVVAGDSAGGYLTLALAERLLDEGERPAAMVCMSPLTQIAKEPRQAHPNMRTDAMFPARAFDAFVDLVSRAGRRGGQREEIYEPLDHIKPGLPATLIQVSDSEVLLHDARLAARRLAAAGVPVQLQVWPGQVHGFQLAASIVPEVTLALRQIGEYIREATAAPVVEECVSY